MSSHHTTINTFSWWQSRLMYLQPDRQKLTGVLMVLMVSLLIGGLSSMQHQSGPCTGSRARSTNHKPEIRQLNLHPTTRLTLQGGRGQRHTWLDDGEHKQNGAGQKTNSSYDDGDVMKPGSSKNWLIPTSLVQTNRNRTNLEYTCWEAPRAMGRSWIKISQSIVVKFTAGGRNLPSFKHQQCEINGVDLGGLKQFCSPFLNESLQWCTSGESFPKIYSAITATPLKSPTSCVPGAPPQQFHVQAPWNKTPVEDFNAEQSHYLRTEPKCEGAIWIIIIAPQPSSSS